MGHESEPFHGRADHRDPLDFLSDAFADGQRFLILAVVDDFTRECLALVAETLLQGLRVVRELEVILGNLTPTE